MMVCVGWYLIFLWGLMWSLLIWYFAAKHVKCCHLTAVPGWGNGQTEHMQTYNGLQTRLSSGTRLYILYICQTQFGVLKESNYDFDYKICVSIYWQSQINNSILNNSSSQKHNYFQGWDKNEEQKIMIES